jgi:hypothetical protein
MARRGRNRARADREPRRVRVDADPEGVRVRDARPDVGVAEARRRFGGIDVPASLVGMLTALAFLVLFAGLVGAAIGAIGYQTGLSGDDEEISLASLIGGLLALVLAYLLGGWTAGRIARYDGPLNGAMTGVWTLVLAAVFAGLGAWVGSEYDVLRNVDLPQWFSRDAFTTGAIVSGVVAIAAMLIGGALGGAWGERFHRHADATIAATRPGGIEAGAVRR